MWCTLQMAHWWQCAGHCLGAVVTQKHCLGMYFFKMRVCEMYNLHRVQLHQMS